MKNKVVIITGASSGIGKACALQFGKAGTKLVLAARSKDKLMAFVNELNNKGMEAIGVVTDVSQEEQCQNLIEKAKEAYGRIDVMLNNAGISMRALFKDVDLSVLKQVMDINFWGTVYCTKYALDEIIKNKGSVIGISSIAGYKGLPGRTANNGTFVFYDFI